MPHGTADRRRTGERGTTGGCSGRSSSGFARQPIAGSSGRLISPARGIPHLPCCPVFRARCRFPGHFRARRCWGAVTRGDSRGCPRPDSAVCRAPIPQRQHFVLEFCCRPRRARWRSRQPLPLRWLRGIRHPCNLSGCSVARVLTGRCQKGRCSGRNARGCRVVGIRFRQ